MKMSSSLVLLALLASGHCYADYYQAAMNNVNWNFSSKKGICVLKQEVPLYGSAEFFSKPGQPLRFSVQELRRKPPIIKASLTAMPAPWMHQTTETRNYEVYLDNAEQGKDYGRLSVYSDAAEAMLDALLEGQYPTFSYVRASSSLNVEEARVAVSSVKFSEAYKKFSDCRNQSVLASVANNTGLVGTRKKRRG